MGGTDNHEQRVGYELESVTYCKVQFQQARANYFQRDQASADMWLRPSLFRDVTQRWLVVGFGLFGTAISSHRQESEYLILDDGTERFVRNVGNQVQIYAV
jgi:hypothetical protein